MEDKKKKDSTLKHMFVTRTEGFIDVSKKIEFWKAFAQATNGSLQIKQTVAKDLAILTMSIPYKNYIIEFSESDTHPLKITCELNLASELEFIIAQKDWLDNILGHFSKKYFNTGDNDFDKVYAMQSNHKEAVLNLLSGDRIKRILLENNVHSFGCKYNTNKHTETLTCIVSRTVNSQEELNELYELFKIAIDKLENL